MVVSFLLLAILLAFPAASLAAFGLATTTDYYAVDAGAVWLSRRGRTAEPFQLSSPGQITTGL